MKISKIAVKNFRLLQDAELSLEDDLSLVIGKNNCGKTSLLTILEKFLSGGASKFSFDDFSLPVAERIEGWVNDGDENTEPPEEICISLYIHLDYDESDDLRNIGDTILLDLDPEIRTAVLLFQYGIDQGGLKKLKADFRADVERRKDQGSKAMPCYDFLKREHGQYYKKVRKSLRWDKASGQPDETVFIDLDQEKVQIDKILKFRFISARRGVSNKDSDRTLSGQSSSAYERLALGSEKPKAVQKLEDTLFDTDSALDPIYDEMFEDILGDVLKFGGAQKNEMKVSVKSSLRGLNVLKDNTTVRYDSNNGSYMLPESYNGLGYLNLISMIFELRSILEGMSATNETPAADVNLLFIEEPEAHTHPQLQYIFIKNIKSLLRAHSKGKSVLPFDLQTVITTHSSHIVSESDFADIKFMRKFDGFSKVLNLSDLEKVYEDQPAWYKFLKQYVTVHRSELFFADKAIFFEGDTERVAIPAMMEKLDAEILVKEIQEGAEQTLPLKSQNVSLIEVGAHFKTFERFVQFIGLKSLVITDIDTGRMEPSFNDDGSAKLDSAGNQKEKIVPCGANLEEATLTTNATIKFFFKDDEGKPDEISELFSHTIKQKVFSFSEGEWCKDEDGILCVVYQVNEINDLDAAYTARSFEDAFFHINRKFMDDCCPEDENGKRNFDNFPSLTQKHVQAYLDGGSAYDAATKAIGSKPSFAIEVLLNSAQEEVRVSPPDSPEKPVQVLKLFSNWETPAYIKEGLEWLRG